VTGVPRPGRLHSVQAIPPATAGGPDWPAGALGRDVVLQVLAKPRPYFVGVFVPVGSHGVLRCGRHHLVLFTGDGECAAAGGEIVAGVCRGFRAAARRRCGVVLTSRSGRLDLKRTTP